MIVSRVHIRHIITLTVLRVRNYAILLVRCFLGRAKTEFLWSRWRTVALRAAGLRVGRERGTARSLVVLVLRLGTRAEAGRVRHARVSATDAVLRFRHLHFLRRRYLRGRLMRHPYTDLRHRLSGHRYQRRHLLVTIVLLLLQAERDAIDALIQRDHHDQRDPEVSDLQDAVEQSVLQILHVAAAFRNRPPGVAEVLPAEDGREEHDHRHDPRDGDHRQHCALRPPVAVLRRDLHHAVAVDRDAEYGVDGRHAHHVVDRQPQIAQDLAQVPVLVAQQVDGVEGHGDGADQQVGAGERRDEVVGRLTDRALQHERHQHDDVPDDSDHARQTGEAAQDDDLPQREPRWTTGGICRVAVAHIQGVVPRYGGVRSRVSVQPAHDTLIIARQQEPVQQADNAVVGGSGVVKQFHESRKSKFTRRCCRTIFLLQIRHCNDSMEIHMYGSLGCAPV